MRLKHFSAFIKEFSLEYITTIVKVKIFDKKCFFKKMPIQLNIAEKW